MIPNQTLVPTEDRRYVKDLRSKAILNIDTASYESFKNERQRVLRQQQLEQQVSNLQQDMSDIKQLLQQLLNGRTNGDRNI
jgi:hypothetical protein